MTIKPFLKWAGGKTSLLPEIVKRLPPEFDSYYEPFLGGGALFCYLDLTGKLVGLNDSNEELINCWRNLKHFCEELITELSDPLYTNDKDTYLAIRVWDRLDWYGDSTKVSHIEKAARFIFLNKTCFNGLYRVNSKGHFNVPFGKYKNPTICNSELLRKISAKLSRECVEITSCDYSEVLPSTPNSFVYLDPPYDVLNETSNFTSYTKNKFGKGEQIKLSEYVFKLNNLGVKFLLSNSDTPFINDLYKNFIVEKIQCKRSINCKGDKRGKISEVLIRNYEVL